MRPGSEATYVRLWPRISASSRTPPREMRWNLRPRALATDWATLVFPVPGGPTRRRIGEWPRRFTLGAISILGCFDVLGDDLLEEVGGGAVSCLVSLRERLSFRTARYASNRFLTSSNP